MLRPRNTGANGEKCDVTVTTHNGYYHTSLEDRKP